MYIEDLIIDLGSIVYKVNQYDVGVVDSLCLQMFDGTGFTEKQCNLALRLLGRYATLLNSKLNSDIRPFLENPQFRLKIRKSVLTKTIKIIDHTEHGRSIEVRFPYNDATLSEFRKNKGTLDNFVWDKDSTSWIFALTEKNIRFLIDRFDNDGFDYSDEYQNLVDQISSIMDNMEKYAPMLSINNGELKILNSPEFMPKINTTDILEALFLARNYGVSLWDEHIDDYVKSNALDAYTRKLLQSNGPATLEISSDFEGISCLKTIMTYSGPTLFIIPGGNEMTKLTQVYTILKGFGLEDKNMSVLFRLSSETGRNFNNFVKNQGLNGPICDETKAVFISGKLPKTILKSGIRFNSIVNMGFSNAHYTLKEYSKKHQNLVYFDVTIKSQGFNFVEL